MQDLAQNAIQAALEGNWSKARDLNLKILRVDTKNIDALNRLSKAYLELGDSSKAIRYCKKVLKIDDLNTIASKNLERFNFQDKPHSNGTKLINPNAFLVQPGKTKLVELINISANISPSNLDPGSQVRLHIAGFRVSIFSLDGQYIGKIADDISQKIKIDKQNNLKYEAWIKDCQPDKIVVFLKPTS